MSEDMTEKDVIEYLKNRYLVVGSPLNPQKEECERHNAVIDMAIKAQYSEFYFCDTLWPDFDEREFDKALIAYQHRERRFGGVKP